MPAPISSLPNFTHIKWCNCKYPSLECIPCEAYLNCKDCGGRRAYPQKTKRLWSKPFARISSFKVLPKWLRRKWSKPVVRQVITEGYVAGPAPYIGTNNFDLYKRKKP